VSCCAPSPRCGPQIAVRGPCGRQSRALAFGLELGIVAGAGWSAFSSGLFRPLSGRRCRSPRTCGCSGSYWCRAVSTHSRAMRIDNSRFGQVDGSPAGAIRFLLRSPRPSREDIDGAGLHDCSDCYRLERKSPGGSVSHWVIAPFHGAHREILHVAVTPCSTVE
jgi:hypothetical protein